MVELPGYTKKFQLKILTLNENPVTFNVSSGNYDAFQNLKSTYKLTRL